MGRLTASQTDGKFRIVIVTNLTILIVLFFISLCVGRYSISLTDCVKILLHIDGETVDGTAQQVIRSLRLPRTIASALVGISLSVSGLVFQSTFQNKLVSPDILGVSSGACVGAAIAILLGLSSVWIGLFSFTCGIAAVCLALFIPRLIHNQSTLALVLSGIIVGSFMNSLIGLFKFIADPTRQLAEITYWIMGSIAGVKPQEIFAVSVLVVPALAVILLLRWRINVLSLGEEEATSVGLSYRRMRLVVIICATLLTSASTSISGSIGWIGLVIPHFSRFIAGEDHRKNLPLAVLMGASFMILADLLARTLSMNEIPLSIITGFVGTPLYIFLLWQKGVNLQ